MSYWKANVARFALKKSSSTKNDRKLNSVLRNFWKTLKPEDQLTDGIHNKTIQVQRQKLSQG